MESIRPSASDQFARRLLDPAIVGLVFVVLAGAAGLHEYFLSPAPVEGARTHYNNYVIFKSSFRHLQQGTDLYRAYASEHHDLFKYSPTFALLMAPFAALPDAVGLVLWDVLGAVALLGGLWLLPAPDLRWRMAAAWFITLSMLQSAQNSQSNALLAGLMILSFAWMEGRQPLLAALASALAFYIKIYGALGFILALLFPRRLRFAAYGVLWMAILGVLPLAVTPLDTLLWQYRSWAGLLAHDQSALAGVSVMTWLERWYGLTPPKPAVMATGFVLMLLPLLRVRSYTDRTFRVLLLATVLIYVVIFNHMAEPNTFLIAVCGVALWYFAQAPSPVRFALLSLVFVFTCLSTTSVFPPVLRRRLVQPLVLRVVPCILVWAAAVWQLAAARWRPREPGNGP